MSLRAKNADKARGFRRLGYAWALALGALFLACGGDDDLELLKLRSLEIDEEAATLYVLGEGLVPGARCTTELRGTAYPTGRAARATVLELPCRVLTDERSVVDLADEALHRHGRGWFEGALTLRLRAPEGEQTVSGAISPVRLRLGAHGRSALDAELSLARAARHFQEQLGIRGVEATDGGVLITALHEDGSLARAGARPHDLVRRLNGAPVADASDLLAAENAAEARVELVRRGVGQVLVTVPLRPASRVEPLWTFTAALLAFVLSLLWPARGEWLGHRAPIKALPWLVPASVPAFACVLFGGQVDTLWVWLFALAVHGGSFWIGHAKKERSTLELARDALDLALATLCIAALALCIGSLERPLLARDGEALSLWDVPAVATPAGVLACLGLWLALSPRRGQRTRPTHEFVRAASALVVALVGFGAGRLPAPLASLEGPALIACELVWLFACAALVHSALMGPVPGRHARAWAGALSLTAVAAALIAPWVAQHLLPHELCAALALGCLAGRAIGAVYARTAHKRAAPRDPALNPFL